MKLPNLEKAQVSEAKITRYLLNLAHETGKAKAAFFMAFRFSGAAWEVMKTALLEHAAQHEVKEIIQMPRGVHYVIEGTLTCPDGRAPIVRVVWRVDEGSDNPRFITAYSGE
jgi:hypothetical protein